MSTLLCFGDKYWMYEVHTGVEKHIPTYQQQDPITLDNHKVSQRFSA